ncbi:DUF1826 domain-containing protein [Marinobacterium jannaschii]|uniref:DUF1826 domain-containing protein n=1 Tax=Marinobacterium jannaschii TaxID=64970 RepID=UPI00068861AD|nr:DUF1826 domain-containing protein [Marinobacterium jannaschii]
MAAAEQLKTRQLSTQLPQAQISDSPEVLTEIYQPDCNLAVWQRDLVPEINSYIAQLNQSGREINLRTLLSCDDGLESESQALLQRKLPEGEGKQALIDNICELLDMYQCLFEPQQIGVRFATLRRAMCPKFHVDYLPARLVTCFGGNGTEWLPEPQDGSPRIPEGEPKKIEQLKAGDVALLKGDGWFENEGYGIVHRSPAVAPGEMRLFLSLDFAD